MLFQVEVPNSDRILETRSDKQYIGPVSQFNGTAGQVTMQQSNSSAARTIDLLYMLGPLHVTAQWHIHDTSNYLASVDWLRKTPHNSHIRHSRAGRALLRSRKECGWLWVLLGSAVQACPHTLCGMCIDSYLVLPEISSFVITCTYLFTADDNHLQKSTIRSSVICRYTGHQQSLHQPKFGHFFSEIRSWNHMEVLRYKAAIV